MTKVMGEFLPMANVKYLYLKKDNIAYILEKPMYYGNVVYQPCT